MKILRRGDHSRPPLFARRLFGYRPEDVERFLEDRESVLLHTGELIRAAEEQRSDLEAEAESLRERVASLETTSTVPAPVDFTSEQLDRVLRAAQETATRILEEARAGLQRERRESEEALNAIRSESSALEARMSRLAPLLPEIRASVGAAVVRLSEAPRRLAEALMPLNETMRSVEMDIDRLEQCWAPSPEAQGPAPDSAAPGEIGDQAEELREHPLPVPEGPPNPPASAVGDQGHFRVPEPPISLPSDTSTDDQEEPGLPADEDDAQRFSSDGSWVAGPVRSGRVRESGA
jgi:cell division septum initiation protein DivIVA